MERHQGGQERAIEGEASPDGRRRADERRTEGQTWVACERPSPARRVYLAEVSDDLEHQNQHVGPDHGDPKGGSRDRGAVGGGDGGVGPEALDASLARAARAQRCAPGGLTDGDDEDTREEVDGGAGHHRDEEEDEADGGEEDGDDGPVHGDERAHELVEEQVGQDGAVVEAPDQQADRAHLVEDLRPLPRLGVLELAVGGGREPLDLDRLLAGEHLGELAEGDVVVEPAHQLVDR